MARGVAGLGVLAVVVQSSGGLAVDLLGPDVLLAAVGFAVTHTVLTDRVDGTGSSRSWYRRQTALRVPLLIMMFAAVLAVGALAGQGAAVARSAADAAAGLWPFGLAELAPPVGRLSRVDPFGTLWLIGLLALFGLGWPAALARLHNRLRADRERAFTVLAPALLGAAASVWLLGRFRASAGADLAEFALGAHIRLAEWLVGAAAAAAVVGLDHFRPSAPRSVPVARLLGSRSLSRLTAAAGAALLLATSAVAYLWPQDWLLLGAPVAGSLGTAMIIFAGCGPDLDRFAAQFGRGVPAELGHMAFPLLVLHAPLFWLVQLAVPGARPFALIVVGGGLAWLVGLVVQDGLVRRWHARGTGPARAVSVAAALLAGFTVSVGTSALAPGTADHETVVLVLGGSTGGQLAAALSNADPRITVTDGTRPGCGLLPGAPTTVSTSRTTATAQAPASALDCGDSSSAWRGAVRATRPDVVVVDTGADAVPRTSAPSPCDPEFRARYRTMIAQLVTVVDGGDPTRPLLLTTVVDRGLDPGARCVNALVAEAAGAHRSVTVLDLDGRLCPAGVCPIHTPAGELPHDLDGRLIHARFDELGIWLGQTVDTALRERTAHGPTR